MKSIDFFNISCDYGYLNNNDMPPVVNKNFILREGLNLLTGDNGSGKSTILKALMNEVPNVFGQFSITDTNDPSNVEKREDIKKFYSEYESLFYLPQKFQGFFPSHTCVNTFLDYWYKTSLGKVSTTSKTKDEPVCQSILNDLDVTRIFDRVRWNHCEYLSGGEAQIVAMIAMYISNKEIVLLDEPTSALSKKNADLIKKIIGTYILRNKTATVVISTHDPALFSDQNPNIIDCT